MVHQVLGVGLGPGDIGSSAAPGTAIEFHYSATGTHAINLISTLQPRVVVVRGDAVSETEACRIGRYAAAGGSCVIIRFRGTAGGTRTLSRLCSSGAAFRMSIPVCDDSRADILASVSDPLFVTSRVAILRQLLPHICTSSLRFVALALGLAERDRSVTSLARATGLAPRTLQLQLAQLGLPRPKSLLLSMTALHALWYRTNDSWSGKRVAAQLGYTSERLLSNSVERATGIRFTKLYRTTGFAELADEIAGHLGRERPSQTRR